MANTIVKDIRDKTIISKDKKIKAATIIWAAGIKANAIKTNQKLNWVRAI